MLPPFLRCVLDLADDLRIELSGLGKQNRLCIGGELRMQIDRNADHAEIVVQEILARRLIRLVARDARWDCRACPIPH